MQNLKKKFIMPYSLLLAVTLVLLSFQACDQISKVNSGFSGIKKIESNQSQPLSGGSGEGYEGKPTNYYFTNINKCKELGKPNEIVDSQLMKKDNRWYVVREQCHDIKATEIKQSSLYSSALTPLILGLKEASYILEKKDYVPKFEKPGDSYIVAICRGHYVDKGENKGKADGVVRIIKGSAGNTFYEAEFFTKIPQSGTRDDNGVGQNLTGEEIVNFKVRVGDKVELNLDKHNFAYAFYEMHEKDGKFVFKNGGIRISIKKGISAETFNGQTFSGAIWIPWGGEPYYFIIPALCDYIRR